MFDPQQYCDENYRSWSDDRFSYFADHIVLFRTPRQSNVPIEKNPESLDSVWKGVENISILKPLPVIKKPKESPCHVCQGVGKTTEILCPECDGTGYLEFTTSHNMYDCECKTCEGNQFITTEAKNGDLCFECDGKGKIVEWGEFAIENCRFNQELIYKISTLPGVKYSSPVGKDRIRFIFDGGEGVLMGLR